MRSSDCRTSMPAEQGRQTTYFKKLWQLRYLYILGKVYVSTNRSIFNHYRKVGGKRRIDCISVPGVTFEDLASVKPSNANSSTSEPFHREAQESHHNTSHNLRVYFDMIDISDWCVWWCFLMVCLIIFVLSLFYVMYVSFKLSSAFSFDDLNPAWVFVQRSGRCRLGSSKRRPVRAGSYHASKHRMLFLSISANFNLLMPNSNLFESFWNIAWQSSFHNTLTVWGDRSALGGVDDEFPDAHVGRVPSRFVGTVPLTRAFHCFWPFTSHCFLFNLGNQNYFG